MSQVAPDAGVVILAEEYLLESLIVISMIILVIYDYAITLYREVTWIWLRKWTFATWIFLANRYLTITAVLFVATRPTAQRYVPKSRYEITK
ncbi:hypothetical protein EW026_g819 [Hermanssonia centrifuga]|uniref:DUF6533 domain-containing protein n=1 Tax=Hermanssonia centrifuga TaxID=98765 RepID=A0A4S4KVB1_9APHY|nr:hypothetical protein EW026_g819 [Hermanssonia centrifuga]